MLAIIIMMAAFMAARRPCRLKACRGVTHRGPCPRLSAAGRKGGRPAGQPVSDAERKQRSKAARKQRSSSASRNAAVRAANLRRAANHRRAGRCAFCGIVHDGSKCEAAANASTAGRTVARLARAGIKQRADEAAATAAALEAAAAVIRRPIIATGALPPSWPLACEGCGFNGPLARFDTAWQDAPGWGRCLKCADSGSVSLLGVLSLLLWPVALLLGWVRRRYRTSTVSDRHSIKTARHALKAYGVPVVELKPSGWTPCCRCGSTRRVVFIIDANASGFSYQWTEPTCGPCLSRTMHLDDEWARAIAQAAHLNRLRDERNARRRLERCDSGSVSLAGVLWPVVVVVGWAARLLEWVAWGIIGMADRMERFGNCRECLESWADCRCRCADCGINDPYGNCHLCEANEVCVECCRCCERGECAPGWLDDCRPECITHGGECGPSLQRPTHSDEARARLDAATAEVMARLKECE